MDDLKVDKDYLEAFNQGYELSKELGLKPEILKDLAEGNKRMQAMKDGMEEHGKELLQQKSKELIPPFDMDKFKNRDIRIESDNTEKDKDLNKDKDREIDI